MQRTIAGFGPGIAKVFGTMRFLCFHGRGTNAEIFQKQTLRLRGILGAEHDFVFINGKFDVGQGSRESQALSELAYVPVGLGDNPVVLRNLLAEVQRYIAANGPFGGVLGFSEGAGVAATLMVDDWQTGTGQFKCAILFSSMSAVDPKYLKAEPPILRELGCDADDISIHVPTLHVWSAQGEPEEIAPARIASICEPDTKEIYVHTLGHRVPGSSSDECLGDIAKLMERVIERSKNL